ncbi:MAG: hypothetical protein RLZZ127_1147 [Planctomycetota bacterium]|jgi:hypothetical protein
MEPDLVLAMPRRLLWRVGGFVPTVDLAVLECLQDESWFAAPEILRQDLDAKEVRIGVLLRQGAPGARQALVSESGVLLHAAPVPPEVERLGKGLKGLKELAAAAGRHLVGSHRAGIELAGYLNEDSLPETRPFLVLVYRMTLLEPVAPPPGMLWIGAERLRGMPLDPASALVAECAGA